jgi:trimeric autotransporter adhesin
MATFNGDSNANTINRSASTTADLINGLAGNDTLIGSNFNDTLDGGTGTDSMSGGLGNDRYIVDATTDIVVEAANGGNDTVQSSVTYSLNTASAAQVENLILAGTAAINATGNALANVLTGNAAANIMSGLDGNDTLLGLGGNDTLSGGNGNDRIDGGTGSDSMTGGAGDDTFVVDSTLDKVVELAGGGTFDRIESSVTLNLSTFAAEVENLSLTGTAAINATGTAVDNSLTGNSAANVLSGLGGNDFLMAGAGNDTLDGGVGNDTLLGETGSDSMVGGDGHDTYAVDSLTDIVVEGSGTSSGQDMIQSSINLNLSTFAANVENLWLTGTTAQSGTGNNGNNFIMGNSVANTLTGLDGDDSIRGEVGNDTLDGGNGNDSLDGGVGDDSMVGGAGNDAYTVDSFSDKVVELAGGGTDSISTSVSLNLNIFADQVENVLISQTGAVTDPINLINVRGNDLANAISGNAAANVLDGDLGIDTLSGNGGDDTYEIDGTVVNGVIVADVVNEFSNQGIDTVRANLSSYTLAANVENLTMTGAFFVSNILGNEQANVINGSSDTFIESIGGGAGNDTIFGNGGFNALGGEEGDDSIVGGVAGDVLLGDQTASSAEEPGVLPDEMFFFGNDTIRGGSGNDSIWGNGGDDSLAGDAGDDSILGGLGFDSIVGGDGNDYINGGTEDDIMSGGNGDDIIEGADGDDIMSGSFGDDILVGGAGIDALSGNAGSDQFDGGEGNDGLSGGTGSDYYAFNGDFGMDQLTDSDTLVGSTDLDEAHFFSASFDTLWFSRSADNLVIQQLGTANNVTVVNWFTSTTNQVEFMYDDVTGRQLTAANVNNLVNTMASFAPQVVTSASDATLQAAVNNAWVQL